MKLRNAIIISIIVIVLAMLASQYKDPLSEVDIQYSQTEQPLFRTTLDNGLEITIKETHANPLVTIQFWVHTGSRNEPNEREGVAHIFEHIWFKGTESQPVGSFHKSVEKLGGELNAMTSHDWTMFYVTVPSEKFDVIFPLMVDLLRNPGMFQEEITKELQVILEEQRQSYNNPLQHADDEFAQLLIEEHPYRNPIIGYKNTIANMTREDIETFYNTWYVPNNMNLVIVGDIDTAETVKKIEEAMGDMQYAPLPELNNIPQEKITENRYNSDTREIGYSYLAIGYIVPESTHPDHYPLKVMNTLFSEMESSIMQHKLKSKKNLIVRGGSVVAQLNDFGAFQVFFVVDPEKRNEAVAATLTELNKLKYAPVTDEDLERAKTYIKTQRARKNEQIFEMGMEIGEAWIDGNLDNLQYYNQKIDDVTKEDIIRVANEYIGPYTMYELKAEL